MTQRQKMPKIIETTTDLDRLARRLSCEKVLAFDLEADSLHHYREKVCLIQVATDKAVFLVDPLAVTDVSPLGSLLEDPGIRKVFHGADYDIRSLHRDFSLEVRNLFDTMIACQLLGEKEVGLAAVLKKRFGVELDKRYQKADWSRRPLDPGMIAYAAADTSLLVALYRQLEAELLERGRLSWVEEESELLSEVRAADREGEPFVYRFKGASKMDPRTLAVLEELLRFRDLRARSADKPPFKVLSNETLRALAEKKPRNVNELQGIPGLPPRFAERYGRDVVKAVADGCAIPEELLPRFARAGRPERDALKDERLRRLKRWREAKSLALGIDAGFLVNNALLEALAKEAPKDAAGLDAVATLRGWRKREFGGELLEALR
ncbi:MAG: ribonuclease D [Geobacteraceae bacterium]|nr:ribonuclease D [Geobacteraceae bacterium]